VCKLKYAAVTIPKYQQLHTIKGYFSLILHGFGESVEVSALCYPTQKWRMMENQLSGVLVVAKKVVRGHVVMC
jgi:hypothetical protein